MMDTMVMQWAAPFNIKLQDRYALALCNTVNIRLTWMPAFFLTM